MAYTQDMVLATDLNPDPNIFEMNLVADEAMIDVTGDGLADAVFAFNGTVPGPMIEAAVGDTVIVHFTNNLDLATTIHWHGLEVNNANDGSPLVQDEIPPGGSFTYQFKIRRPGMAWYHPHVMPTDQAFRGLYGAFLRTDPRDTALINAGVLPSEADTLSVMLSDITSCTGLETNGVCAANSCGPTGGQACAAGDVPFVQPNFDCRRIGGAGACDVDLGTSVLINGRPLETGDLLDVDNGQGLRIRFINSAILRYFRLSPPVGHQLFRVGGEQGLLDNVRLEGGTQGTFVTGYDTGEILLAPGDRADVVIVPTGTDGQTRAIRAIPYVDIPGTTGAPKPSTGPENLIRLRINGPPTANPFAIAEGDPLLTHAAVNDPLEQLPSTGFDSLLDPATEVAGAPKGTNDPTITLQRMMTTACFDSTDCRMGTDCRDGMLLCPTQSNSPNCSCDGDGDGPAIDGVRGLFDLSFPDFNLIPHLASSRYAKVGDLLELAVHNDTRNHHPFHMHGFSFQPVRIERGPATLYTFDYREFVDNYDIHDGHTLVFRVRLEERPKPSDIAINGGGGAEGRWLFHCHLFHHANLGMISELVVLPDDIFADGFESTNTSQWDTTVGALP